MPALRWLLICRLAGRVVGCWFLEIALWTEMLQSAGDGCSVYCASEEGEREREKERQWERWFCGGLWKEEEEVCHVVCERFETRGLRSVFPRWPPHVGLDDATMRRYDAVPCSYPGKERSYDFYLLGHHGCTPSGLESSVCVEPPMLALRE